MKTSAFLVVVDDDQADARVDEERYQTMVGLVRRVARLKPSGLNGMHLQLDAKRFLQELGE